MSLKQLQVAQDRMEHAARNAAMSSAKVDALRKQRDEAYPPPRDGKDIRYRAESPTQNLKLYAELDAALNIAVQAHAANGNVLQAMQLEVARAKDACRVLAEIEHRKHSVECQHRPKVS